MLRFRNKFNEEVCRGFTFANLFNSLSLSIPYLSLGKVMTNFQDLVAKVKNLGALAPVLGAISRPDIARRNDHLWELKG